jgi:hypothetical protein
MSIAIRHPLYGEPIPPQAVAKRLAEPQTRAARAAPAPRGSLVAAILASARTLFGPSRSGDAEPARPAKRADPREHRSVFHHWAADLAYRDVAHPLFKDSCRR